MGHAAGDFGLLLRGQRCIGGGEVEGASQEAVDALTAADHIVADVDGRRR